VKDEVVQRGWQGAQAIELLVGVDENVFRKPEAAQTAVGPPHALDRRLAALRHDDKQVQVAALFRRSPRMRTKKPDPLRMEFIRQSLNDFVEELLVNCFHGTKANMAAESLGSVD